MFCDRVNLVYTVRTGLCWWVTTDMVSVVMPSPSLLAHLLLTRTLVCPQLQACVPN
jgi:hypothetical protein